MFSVIKFFTDTKAILFYHPKDCWKTMKIFTEALKEVTQGIILHTTQNYVLKIFFTHLFPLSFPYSPLRIPF